MIPRQEVFDAYWRLAAERQEIFFRRMLGKPAPWTNDPVLLEYKFCNAYRASDRTSQFLIRNVIYNGSKARDEVIFRVLLFKIFNKIETWQGLVKRLGEVSLSSFDFDKYSRALQGILDSGQPVYTSAYMSCANKAFGFSRKHLNHLALVERMCVKDAVHDRIVNAKGMEEAFLILREYPLIGDFMAYQLATDINYSGAVDWSENSFTIAGPGAKRGIAKCFAGKVDEAEAIKWMQENQGQEFERLGLNFKTLFGRELQLIDCQNLFCETDKYSRVAFPGLKSNRKRIKARFAPIEKRIPYFYPPKWGINRRLEKFIADNP